MKIGQNKVVEISYAVEVEGKIVDQRSEAQPLDYIHGANMLLPKFEEALEGQEPGYEFAFGVGPEDGYGEYEKEKVVELPKTAFMIDGKFQEQAVKVGSMIPMFNGQGQVVPGMVLEVKEEGVVMDFNHPMAGKSLNFTGKVLSVREATEKELTEGLHGEFLPHQGCGGGCSGGCGGCGGGCHGEGGCHKDGEGCHKEGDGGCDCGGNCGCGN